MEKIYKELQNKKDAIILAIESSCDETSASVVVGGTRILSNVISSQIPIHRKFGGVVPEVASRNHTLAINEVVEQALSDAGVTANDVDCIAVAYGAGLAGALMVGVSFAKAMAYALNKPLIKVNHIQAHICANYIEHKDLKPPFMAVVASGGHTSIVKVSDYNDFELLGGTCDDAIGEAFDKVARLLGLPYPGGPEIDKLSKLGTANIDFFKHDKGVNKELKLSYSGLKTAVVNYINTAQMKSEQINKADVCASFTQCAVAMLVKTAVYGATQNGYKQIVLAGGVASNSYLRESLKQECEKNSMKLCVPSQIYCTDNGAMIGVRASISLQHNTHLADLTLNAQSSLKVDE